MSPPKTYYLHELNDQKTNVYRFTFNSPEYYFYEGYLTKDTIWWVMATANWFNYFDITPEELPMVF